MPPSQAFEARFVGYLHVASLSVSVVGYFPFFKYCIACNWYSSMVIDPALGLVEYCKKRLSFAVSTPSRTPSNGLFLIEVSYYLIWICYCRAEAREIRISVLGFTLVSTVFMSQYGRPPARGLWESTLTYRFFSLLSCPVCCLYGLRASFRHILHHRLDLHHVSFVPSCLWGVALEPFHCRVVRRLVAIRRGFRFCNDKFPERGWSGKLLRAGYYGTTYSGSCHNDLCQSHHCLPGDCFGGL